MGSKWCEMSEKHHQEDSIKKTYASRPLAAPVTAGSCRPRMTTTDSSSQTLRAGNNQQPRSECGTSRASKRSGSMSLPPILILPFLPHIFRNSSHFCFLLSLCGPTSAGLEKYVSSASGICPPAHSPIVRHADQQGASRAGAPPATAADARRAAGRWPAGARCHRIVVRVGILVQL